MELTNPITKRPAAARPGKTGDDEPKEGGSHSGGEDSRTRALLKYVVRSREAGLRNEEADLKLRAAGWHVAFALFIGAGFFGIAEGWRANDAIWWAWVTLTTIGYGDFTPTKPYTRLLFVIYAVWGLGTMAVFLAEVIDYLAFQREKTRSIIHKLQAPDKENTLVAQSWIMKCCPKDRRGERMRLAIEVARAFLGYFATLLIGAMLLHLSEGFSFADGIYFAFETSSTIGYGDQGALYRYETSVDSVHWQGWGQGKIPTVPPYWSTITVGPNATAGEVPASECISAKGSCQVVGTSCECTFSDAGKYILMLYSFFAFAAIGWLLDGITAFFEHQKGTMHKITKKFLSMKKTKKEEKEKKKKGDNNEAGDDDDGDDDNDDDDYETSSSLCSSSLLSSRCPRCEGVIEGLAFSAYLFTFMAVGAGIFMALEGDAFADFREAYYFTVMSLTTVGYGDFSPGTAGGKTFLILFGLAGLASMGVFIGKTQTILSKCSKRRSRWYKARCTCCSSERGCAKGASDQDWLLATIICQTGVVFFIGNVCFLISEVGIGQSGEQWVGGTMNGTKWTDVSVLPFFQVVTMTTIGYGAHFYPQTDAGRNFTIFYGWLSLANMAMLIEAISSFVSQRAKERWIRYQADVRKFTGLDELVDELEEMLLASA